MMMKYFLLYFILISIVSSTTISAESIPTKELQKGPILATNFLRNTSFFVAFLAGIVSIISPCILPLFPAFFSYTFKNREEITKMTFVFFLGFTSIFVLMGLIAGYLGQTTLSLIPYRREMILLGGVFLVILGVMSMFGKGFSSFIKVNKKPKNDVLGIFLFGVFFAVGWTACLGPILVGILSIGAFLNNFLYSGMLLFIYSLGILSPLFIISFFYDKYNLSQNRFVRGREFRFNVLGKTSRVHSTNLISGMLFVVMGIVFIVYRGTYFINDADPLGTKALFFSIQSNMIGSGSLNLFGLLVLLVFTFYLWNFLIKYGGGGRND